MTRGRFDRIPLVDIGGLLGTDPAAKAAVAAELARAAGEVGFLYVTNHGIEPALVAGLEAQADAFFKLPLEVKQKYYIGLSTCHRGYVPTGEEGLYKDKPGIVDLKEAFDTALDLPADDPDYLAGNRMLGPNVWPAELPGFRIGVTAYYRAARRLAETLFRGFALALGLEEGFFAPYLTRPTSQLRLIHYPPAIGEVPPSDWGIGPHTDFECFTILHATTPGLQVQNAAGDWVAAPPIPGAFVINIGDMLQAWSNGRFVATGHRVLKTPNERYSFPLFCAVNYDTVVAPLPAFCGPDDPPRYKPIIAGEHLVAQTIRAFRYLDRLLEEGRITLPVADPGFGHRSLREA